MPFNLYMALSSMDILTILILPTHEHKISFQTMDSDCSCSSLYMPVIGCYDRGNEKKVKTLRIMVKIKYQPTLNYLGLFVESD